MTQAEVRLWERTLRRKQLFGYRFIRQRPIDQYIVDFFCPELQLIIEVDGLSHSDEEIFEKDEKRQKELEALGFRFVRFQDAEIMNDFENVVRVLEGIIKELN
jgi:very-short-patch-repair endonuclease